MWGALVFPGNEGADVVICYYQKIVRPISWKEIGSDKWNDFQVEAVDPDVEFLMKRISNKDGKKVFYGSIRPEDVTGNVKFPENLTITGDLNLYGMTLNHPLPKGLVVKEDFYLKGVKGIDSLPEGLVVEGNAWINESSITKIPDGLTFKKSLDASYTNITTFPEMEVGHNLDIRWSKVTVLNDLRVGGELCIKFTHISKLPEYLEIGGDFDMYHTDIVDIYCKSYSKVGGKIYVMNRNPPWRYEMGAFYCPERKAAGAGYNVWYPLAEKVTELEPNAGEPRWRQPLPDHLWPVGLRHLR